MGDDPRGVVELVARESYGRLIAYLAARSGDVAAAEDALSDAFAAALRTWPADGLPDKPEAWLLTAARRRLIDRARHERMRAEVAPAIRHLVREAEHMIDHGFPDERLKLLFVCAHPAIDAGMHTPLMLQVVLGLDAATIASAFLTSPSAMGQRLSRAKARIRSASDAQDGRMRIAFEVPDHDELAPRLDAVLESIYAAYGSGWDDLAGADPRRRGLAQEAVWLARTVLRLMPGEPEARGLLALMLYCEARRPARRGANGDYVPISEQDTGAWDRALIDEAEHQLCAASVQRRAGRFQLEAALQSAHVDGARRGRTDWHGIAVLYEGLVRVSPTAGALVGRAAALGEADVADAGIAALDAIDAQSARNYQPYWAVRAHLLRRAGRERSARDAFDRAIGLTEDPATRRFLIRRRSEPARSPAP